MLLELSKCKNMYIKLAKSKTRDLSSQHEEHVFEALSMKKNVFVTHQKASVPPTLTRKETLSLYHFFIFIIVAP